MQRKNRDKSTGKTRRKTAGKSPVYLFWFGFFVVILLLFIINWKTIRNTVSDTGFIDRITRHTANTPPGTSVSSKNKSPDLSVEDTVSAPKNETPSVPVAIPTPPGDVPDDDADDASLQSTSADPAALTSDPAVSPDPAVPALEPAASPAPATGPVKEPESVRQPAEPPKPAAKPAADKPAVDKPITDKPAATLTMSKPVANKPARDKPAPVPKTTDRPVYFIKFDEENGVILRTKVSRTLPVTDSPLLDALNALLRGTTAAEKKQELRSLIPEGTRVLSATIRGSTAYVSFSEDFQFNTNGIEGYIAQLQQLVWTITEFPNVQDVQFLIEGRRLDYLGEGIQIGSPLSRGNFQ